MNKDETQDWLLQLPLYDSELSKEENFADGSSVKYVVFSIHNNGGMQVEHPSNFVPTDHDKMVITIDSAEQYGSPEYFLMDYDSLFGTRLTTFIKYNSDFFTCDERVFFEAMLIKYRSFDFNPFFWSKESIFKELGIKKDRAGRIIKKFIELSILKTEVRRTLINKQPRQITYYQPIGEAIIDLLPKIFKERDFDVIQNDIKKYLKPAITKQRLDNSTLANVMQ